MRLPWWIAAHFGLCPMYMAASLPGVFLGEWVASAVLGGAEFVGLSIFSATALRREQKANDRKRLLCYRVSMDNLQNDRFRDEVETLFERILVRHAGKAPDFLAAKLVDGFERLCDEILPDEPVNIAS